MARRAIIVCGAQSSGTRMLTRAVESAGFHYLELTGPLSAEKVNNISFPDDMPPDVVLHRSVPEGTWWPDFDKLSRQLEAEDYAVQALALHRDWHSTVHSLLYRGLVHNEEGAERQIRRAWRIISALPVVIFVSYEQFISQPVARRWLFVERLGIPEPMAGVRDENAKHYDPNWPPPGAPRGRLP